MTSTAPINQKEYLKRYLSGGKDGKKKKRKKPKTVATGRGLNIVDDNLEHVVTIEDEDETDLYELAENAPQVAGVFDDRPIHIQQAQDKIFGAKWKSLAADEVAPVVPERSKTVHADSDCSPPRTSKQKDSDDDFSPPRSQERKRHGTSPRRVDRDMSNSPRNQSQDLRPKDRNIRRRGRSSSSVDSPPRKKHVSSDSDASPPRSKNKRRSRSRSISRNNRSRRSSSPKRSKGGRSDSPKRRDRSNERDKRSAHKRGRRSRTPTKKERVKTHSRKRDSDSDISPQRKRKNAGKDDTTSGNRGKNSDLDLSPPRGRTERRFNKQESQNKKGRYAGKDSDSDISPPRRQHSSTKTGKNVPRTNRDGSDSDLSPPRLKIEPPSPSSSTQKLRSLPVKIKQEPLDSETPRTLEGKKAGLQDARTLKAEMELLRKQEQEQFRNMADHISGRGAKAIVRDRKTGRRRDLEEEEKANEEEKEAERKRKAEFDRIGRGVVQEERRAQALEETLHEMAKPVARYAGDEDLERHLKAQEREGDPMLDYLRAKRLKENPELAKPAYKGPDGPPNRFNILPGHRWDGVDRSNGYEKKLFISRNAKEAQREESYKWSVADM